MKELVLFIVTFLLVYLFYLVFVLCRKSVLKKFPDGKNMMYLKVKYGLKINDKNIKKIAHAVILSNSLILSTGVFISCLFDSIIIGVLVAFVPMVLLIFVLYHIIGTYFKKKQ